MTKILEHLFCNPLTFRIFKPVSFQSRNFYFFPLNLAKIECWLWWVNDWGKKLIERFYSLQVRRTRSKNGHLPLIHGNLMSHLWFSISTTRKAMWEWNLLDHVPQLSVWKRRYSFELGNLISLLGWVHLTAPFNNKRTLKFKAQPDKCVFRRRQSTVWRLLPASDYCRTLVRCLNCA